MITNEAAAELGEDDPEVLAAYADGCRKLSEWEEDGLGRELHEAVMGMVDD